MVYIFRDKKIKALKFRTDGYSLQEISDKLSIAKSTASLWVRNIKLSPEAQKKLSTKQIDGRKKAMNVKLQSREKQFALFQQEALKSLQSIPSSPYLAKIFCSLLWWCEGNKNESFVRFTSSDETLIQNYLRVFREGFALDEKKFRVLVHIHPYHQDEQQKQFWSEVTKIPLTQFHRSFQKQNTGKRKHEDYQGCIAVTYYDAKIAKELEAIYNAFTLSLSRGIR